MPTGVRAEDIQMKPLSKVTLVLSIATWTACSSSSPEAPEATGYEDRREAFFELTVNDAEPSNTYTELMRLEKGVAPDESKIRFDLDRLVARLDTSDFKLPGLLWMMYKHADSDLLTPELLEDAKRVLLEHKYWPDERLNEPGETTDSMVYVTENHFILYASSAYLVGQLYRDEVFAASGETGTEKMETFRPRVMRWLELRYKSGFSEWLSNVYYDEDIPGLVALVELAEDEEISQLASMVLDLILADMALNQYRGTFGSTHGRTYENKLSGSRDNTGSTFKLVFDNRDQFGPGNMSSTTLALSTKYLPPRVIYDIANDVERPEMENRQRMGIKLEEADTWGLDTTRFEDGMTFMTLEAYTHPLTIGLWVDMLNAYGWWEHDDYSLFEPFKSVLENELVRQAFAEEAEKDITRNMRPEVNIYTYRTPHYMLSTAQDWRKGYGGDQQSIWQATLGTDAVSFTTHPATLDWDGPTPRYWTGYGTLPRAIQVENVVISIYEVDETAMLYVPNQPLFTHAFLPKDRFDEAYKEGGWFFARKGPGFLALWASDPDADWVTNEDPEHQDLGDHEIIADGKKTVWICELGSEDEYGDFAAFKAAILAARLDVGVEALSVEYDSPSQGSLVMGWDGPLTRDAEPVNVVDYPRYENPYSASVFRDDVISFEYEDPEGKHQTTSLVLDFANRTREVSHFLD